MKKTAQRVVSLAHLNEISPADLLQICDDGRGRQTLASQQPLAGLQLIVESLHIWKIHHERRTRRDALGKTNAVALSQEEEEACHI